jgi:hypothetical protein
MDEDEFGGSVLLYIPDGSEDGLQFCDCEALEMEIGGSDDVVIGGGHFIHLL